MVDIKRDESGRFSPGNEMTYQKEQGYVFTRIARGQPVFPDPLRQEAKDWFRTQAQKIAKVDINRFLRDNEKAMVNTIDQQAIGRMFMFWYDPKLKESLPYYDRFPMIFPIGMYSDGFLGINLHYLPPYYRAKLMDALYTTLNNNTLDEKSKLAINYKILNSTSRFRYFKPCIKRYLRGHLRSNLLLVDPQKWDIVLMLPLARFEKATVDTVWQESLNKLGIGRLV